jgi:hypothetical protein
VRLDDASGSLAHGSVLDLDRALREEAVLHWA